MSLCNRLAEVNEYLSGFEKLVGDRIHQLYN